jgi:hypothetical protein
VNFDAALIVLDAMPTESAGPLILGPVILNSSGVQVRWSPTSTALAPFDAYLAERVELLADPPAGA